VWPAGRPWVRHGLRTPVVQHGLRVVRERVTADGKLGGVKRPFVQTALVASLLLVCGVLSQLIQATYGDAAPTPPPVAPAEGSKGLRIVDGIPVARLRGSAREMGRLHGELFKEQIAFLHREYFDALAVKVLGRPAIDAWAKGCEPFIPEEMREEMRGLAEGAGLPYETVLASNCVTDRLQNVLCSTVVATGDAARDGAVLFGRNLDFPGRNILQKMTVVIVYHREGAPPLAVITWPGLIGLLSGMNAEGVAGATMMIHAGRPLSAGLPYPLMYRLALERAKKAADVRTFLATCRRTCPNNFMVVDGTGAAEVLEWDQQTVAVRSADRGALCSTNYFRSPELEQTGRPIGKGRYTSLEEFLARERGAIDLPRVIAALREVATPWFNNVQSMVFLPATREMHLSVGGKLPAAEQRFAFLPRTALFE